MKKTLLEVNPLIAEEAYGWDPSKFTASSNKKVEWKCKKGHVFEMAIIERTRHESKGCPFCSGRKIDIGFNDLETTHPELAKQAHGWDPKTVTRGSKKKLLWRCDKGHVSETRVYSKVAGTKCPVCSNHKIVFGINDLQTLFPELAKEAHNWDPKIFSKGSHSKKEWKCSKGHVWLAAIKDRTAGSGCPYCAGRKVITGVNDLQTLFPELAKEADGWNPSLQIAGGHKVLGWKCHKGHRFKVSISNRVYGKNGCPYCANRKRLSGLNDLATTHPGIAKEADGWDPSASDYLGYGKKNWKCPKGHKYVATINNRKNGTECPFCKGQKALKGFNDFGTLFPNLSAEAIGWNPNEFTPGSSTIKLWQCNKGHQYKASIKSRAAGGGCPYCSGNKLLIGFNDLSTTHPDVAKTAHGWNPNSVTHGSNVKRKWKCKEGHIWTSTVSGRSAGRGCPSCSSTGFDPNMEGWLYLVGHSEWGLLQIGITNNPTNRLKDHRRIGWQLIDLIGPLDGLLTKNWETDLLKYLKSKGAIFSAQKNVGKFSGHTESWIEESYKANSLKELMNLVRSEE